MRSKLAEAEERRKQLSEEKMKVVRETTGLERHNRMRSASATRREAHYSATVEKRQRQLQEMRDRLKEKHKKHDMVRLKQQLNSEQNGVESGHHVDAAAGGGPGSSGGALALRDKDTFFDD